MEKVIIGERLGKRIKEMGYTQQKFADMMGMRLDTLQSYIKGRSAYSLQSLIEFAEKLDCSYDYLLGYSKSPQREYHEIAEQTRLSEKAIQKLTQYASHYDDEFEGRRYVKSLDKLICEDGALNAIFDYFIACKPVDTMNKTLLMIMQNAVNENPAIKKMGIKADRIISLEEQQMIQVVSRLKDIKLNLSPEFIKEIEELDMKEDNERGMEKLEQIAQSEEFANFLSKVIEICQE